jgi:hypothetical protein
VEKDLVKAGKVAALRIVVIIWDKAIQIISRVNLEDSLGD